MADPLSITASVLAVISAAVQSTKSLYETVQRFKDRNKTLRRLQDELEDLVNILDSLTEVTNAETSMLALLKGPIDRCSQICREFEQSMKAFSGKSKTGFRDWTKMEFMRGDINEFIDTIAGYKSTISVGLGTITVHTSKVSREVLQEYNEMIQDTAYNLEVHLRQIDEKMARLTVENTITSDISIDLNDEREVTKQCLRICEDARSFIESLTNRESSVLQEPGQNATEDEMRDFFEAQLLTRQTLAKNRDSFAEISSRLQERLESLVLHGDSGNDKERLRLQEDINISKQCLEVCKVASEISRQKIYRIGEVIADDDSDQVVVTTLADLFDIKKAQSKGNSAQLVGSMTDESLRHLTEKRYSSRFGAVSSGSNPAGSVTTSSPSATETQRSKHTFSTQTGNEEQSPGPRTRHDKPSPNEMRKRGMGGAMD
jgi:gas vesicle protein